MSANQSEPVKSQTDIPEDEIEIIDLLRVIWKWKYFIIGGTVICAIVAVIISLNMAKIYSIEMVLTPGILKIERDQKIFIDSVGNIKALIESGAFNNEILSQLDTHKSDSVPNSFSFKVKLVPGSNMIKVAYQTADIDQGINLLNLEKELLMERYSKFVKYYRKDIEIQLNLRNSEREKFLMSQNSIKINLRNFEKRIKDLSSEIELINKNTDNLIGNQQKFLSKPRGENGILTALVYSNTIQQNISLANNYKNQLNDYEMMLESEKQNMTESEKQIKNIVDQIEHLEFKKDNIQNIQILKPPTSSPYPIKPDKKRIVILTTFIGIFMMVFLSFLLEYIFRKTGRKLQ